MDCAILCKGTGLYMEVTPSPRSAYAKILHRIAHGMDPQKLLKTTETKKNLADMHLGT